MFLMAPTFKVSWCELVPIRLGLSVLWVVGLFPRTDDHDTQDVAGDQNACPHLRTPHFETRPLQIKANSTDAD